jgi:hypothetical protein
LHLLTCIYIVWANSPCPIQNLFCPLVLRFCRWKNIKDNKKNMVLLLVWDKDTYIGWFLVLFPHICVLEPKLVNLCHTSSLLPSPLPVVVLARLRLLYSLFYSEHINYIQVFGFLLLPYISHAQYNHYGKQYGGFLKN